jgi:hypothetical protein
MAQVWVQETLRYWIRQMRTAKSPHVRTFMQMQATVLAPHGVSVQRVGSDSTTYDDRCRFGWLAAGQG